jgi:superfamily II DNA helicase RecQ
MTATATAYTRKKILLALHIKEKECYFLIRHPVRSNTYFAIKRLPADDRDDRYGRFAWIFEKAKAAITTSVTERILVYCQTVADCGRLYELCVRYLSAGGFSHRDQWKVAAMYHSGTPAETQERVVNDLLSSDGQIAVVFASAALGMGVDVKLVKYVVIYGIPDDYEDIVQMAGRSGRDNQDSECHIYYNSTHLVGKPMEHQLRPFLQSSECRRRHLISAFMDHELTDEFVAIQDKRNCCDICRFGQDSETVEMNHDEEQMEITEKRQLSDEQLHTLRRSLIACQMNARMYDWSVNELTDSLIDRLCSDANIIEVDTIFAAYNLLYLDTARKIMSCFEQVIDL